MMKKTVRMLSLVMIFYAFLLPNKVYAKTAEVNIKVDGKVEKDSNIDILIDVKDIENLYATSVKFIYDTDQLEVNSIEGGEILLNNIDDIMEFGGETNKNGNSAVYSFTFLGDKNGINGSGTLIKINCMLKNDNKLYIDQDKMEIKLVKRFKADVLNYEYKFNGYNMDIDYNDNISDNNSSQNENVDIKTNNDNSVNNKNELPNQNQNQIGDESEISDSINSSDTYKEKDILDNSDESKNHLNNISNNEINYMDRNISFNNINIILFILSIALVTSLIIFTIKKYKKKK